MEYCDKRALTTTSLLVGPRNTKWVSGRPSWFASCGVLNFHDVSTGMVLVGLGSMGIDMGMSWSEMICGEGDQGIVCHSLSST
jgi:hypothetical protein